MAERHSLKVLRTLTLKGKHLTPPGGVHALFKALQMLPFLRGLSEPRPCAGWALNTLISLNSKHEAKKAGADEETGIQKSEATCLGGLKNPTLGDWHSHLQPSTPLLPGNLPSSCHQMTSNVTEDGKGGATHQTGHATVVPLFPTGSLRTQWKFLQIPGSPTVTILTLGDDGARERQQSIPEGRGAHLFSQHACHTHVLSKCHNYR